MERQPFQLLEEKVDQLIALVGRLKQENQTLSKRAAECEQKIETLQKELSRTRQDSEHAESMESEIAGYKAQGERIRSKVEDLLGKLQEFKDME